MITLTTAGLGDFVPTSDFNKVVCSIFIYFGVACIGLLLGSYIASMLDETSRRQARDNRLNSCPNCIRLQNMRDAAERRDLAALATSLRGHPLQFHYSENLNEHQHQENQPLFPLPGTASERFERDDSPFSTGNKKIKRKHHGNTTAHLTMPKSHVPVSKVQPRPKVHTPTTIPETEVVNSSDTHFFSEESVPDISATQNKESSSQTNDNATKTPDQHEHKTACTKRIPSNLNVVPPPPPPPLGVINSCGSWKDTSPKSQQSPFSRTASSELPTTPKQSPRTLEQADLLGSPLTKQILGRQSHTRHASIDINGGFSFENMGIPMTLHETPMGQTPAISDNAPFVPGTHNSDPHQRPPPLFNRQESSFSELGFSIDDLSVTSSNSFESRESDVYNTMKRRVKTAKYVFLTLKEALVNSMVIIAVGCLGFWFVEGFSLVDSKSLHTYNPPVQLHG